MSQSLTFQELVNLAIGTPELGNVNFNALHFFLHSMLEHLQLSNVKREISEDEKDFLKPPPGTPPALAATAEATQAGAQAGASAGTLVGAKKSSSIFHQLQDRITHIERQLNFLSDTPSSAELLIRSQQGKQPAQDMWQLMQLKKKMEVNDEGMNKAMNTLQDLLSNISALKKASETFQTELGNLKESFSHFNLSDMKDQLQQLDEQAKAMEELRQQIGQVKARTGSIPDFTDLVQWSALYEMLAGKSLPEKDPESREKTSRELLSTLGQIPEKHEVLVAQLARLEAQLGETKGLPPELGSEVKSLLARMEYLQSQTEQGKESLHSVSEQVQSFKKQCEKLQKAMERLTKSTADIQIMRDMLEQLDVTKADKAQIQEEMEVKADKSMLEAKVNHGELRVATSQLSEMMHDLLQKMSLQDKDWQKALEKLFVDMDCKLDRMALDPLSRQLEAVWKVVKKFLSEGPRFDADSAAGFKKQLFERVKCISCDRPVNMMTGPHMVTVRKVPLRPRPASANGYEYLARPHRRDSEGNEVTGGQPQQTCWQCQAHHQSCTIKQLSRSQDLTTIYPYGDPTAINYDNTEVDLLGVNGVLYKGRVNSHAAERIFALQREFSAVKARRPPSALRMERARSATTDATTYVSPYAISSVRRIGLAQTGSFRPQESQPQVVVESLDPMVAPSQAPSQPQEDGGMAGL